MPMVMTIKSIVPLLGAHYNSAVGGSSEQLQLNGINMSITILYVIVHSH